MEKIIIRNEDDAILNTTRDASSKMTSAQLTGIVILFGLLATSLLAWKFLLNKRSKDKELDYHIDISRLEIITRALSMYPGAGETADNLNEIKTARQHANPAR